MMRLPFAVGPGSPSPLGATWDGEGVNFALFSENAEKVELCLFDPAGRRELQRIPFAEYTDQVWHLHLGEARPGLLYGYRVHGPYDPSRGHRFNPNKLLLDPYSRALHGAPRPDDAHFGGGAEGPDPRDNALLATKSIVTAAEVFDWQGDRPPATAWADTILYEMHVRGFTRRHAGIPEAQRGTLAALAAPVVIDHLTRLGISAVELLPIHAGADEPALAARGMRNYWGYNPIAWFAPMPHLLAGPALEIPALEIKEAVRALHRAGIEVILDVVYNHTAEGGATGPTYCYRGIDNAVYYRLEADGGAYVNDTGCGNTIDLRHPRVLQLVMESLRYWVEEFHIDGFRFDLATILAREGHGFDPGSGFLDAIGQDPVLSRVKLIAEPWDLGPGGYQLGQFPPGWAEWNDRYRDTLRLYWQGRGGMIGEFANRITASSGLFERYGRRPWASVNFITAHDGFTLADLVSYESKHNEANGENNADGSDQNNSWNCGVEGPTDDPEIRRLRLRHRRNLLACLVLSQGTPMLLAGDEMGHSQQGNNNAYCQDNELTWLDWDSGEDFAGFVADLIRLRRNHPAFRRRKFLHGADLAWLSPLGGRMTAEDWTLPFARCVGVRLGGGDDSVFLLLTNAHDGRIPFRLPPESYGAHWRPVLDTASADGKGPSHLFAAGETYPLAGHALALLRQEAAHVEA